MSELIQKFIGVECLIYSIDSNTIEGIIKEVKDNWVFVEGKHGEEMINIEYIVRIREYPKNKKGKKISLFFGCGV